MSPFRRRAWRHAARGWAVALLLIVALPLARADSARAQSFAAATVAQLIAAINAANGNGQTTNTITLVSGATYTLAAANNGASGDETGLPRITSNLTITGIGTTIARSSAAGTPHFRIFAVDSGGALTLSGLTIRSGSLMGGAGATGASSTSVPGGNGGLAAGGAIIVTGGMLSVVNCIFAANSATGGAGGDGGSGANNGSDPGSGGSGGDGGSARGGAINNRGTLIVSGTTFVGNSATGGAGGDGGHGGNASLAPGGMGGNAGRGADGSGGALLNTGSLTVTNTTFTANTVVGGAGGNGGVGGSGVGIHVDGNGGNGGDGAGGAINGTLAAKNVTIARNSATGGVLGTGGAGHGANGLGVGGGIQNGGGGTVTNTLLATNGASGNCGGNLVGDGGYNLEFDPSATCHFSDHAQAGDPGLGTLANHGGPTPTLDIALAAGRRERATRPSVRVRRSAASISAA